jgi:YihY family inner membrane protein
LHAGTGSGERAVVSTAAPIPETWELTGDDARETLLHTGRWQLMKDAFMRMRLADGFSHARSLAFLMALVLLEGIIGLVGFASVLGSEKFGGVVADLLEAMVPGPAGEVLTQTVRQARTAAVTGQWIGLTFGVVGALVTGTTLMGQMERVLNRLYGIERDRPTLEKYTRAFLLALTSGLAASLAFVMLAFGRSLTHNDNLLSDTWRVLRWPVALGLVIAAIALVFRWAPRRHQPAWSWLAYGATLGVIGWAVATVGLGLFLDWSSSFGDTYGPLAGTVALLLWSLLASIAVVYGAAVAAQLEAVRAAGMQEEETPPADRVLVAAAQQ